MRAFRLAYDGRPYRGFQRQPDVPTVEDAVFDALADLDIHDPAAAKPRGYAAAGRTDAGVSAVAQTVAFECPDWCTPRALNPALPDAIRAWAWADVPDDFHATHDARRREYTYHLHAPDAAVDRARAAAAILSGRHDFHNLTTDDRDTVRAVDLAVRRDGEYLVLTASASGFPRELVRRLVSLVRAAASATADDDAFDAIDRALGPERIDGAEGVPPAPAYPLVLTAVAYDVDFAIDPIAAASARETFETLRTERATLARVAGAVVDGVEE